MIISGNLQRLHILVELKQIAIDILHINVLEITNKLNKMGKSKQKYIEIHDPLADRYYGLIQKIIKDEELLYEQLGANEEDKNEKV